MFASRTSTKVASASIRALRQRPAARYSTASDAAPKGSSSGLPLMLTVATIAIGGGSYYSLSIYPSKTTPRDHQSQNPDIPQDHVNHIVTKIQKGHELSAEEEAKIKHACLDLKELYRKNAPKATHRGPSEYNHEKFASSNNEHKVRHGVFSGKDFDNHISNHSSDPAKDFEVIEKKDGEGKAEK